VSLWFEDIVEGRTAELGAHLFTDEEIIRFAERFDPQPFHLSREAARKTHFGDLCASGWHTACVCMRLIVEHRLREAGGSEALAETMGPSPGFRELKWLKPVYAGEAIRFTTTVESKRPLASRPGWGLVSSRSEGFNPRGELAFSFLGAVFVRRRSG
jgi:acyl dehydratase